MSNIQKILLIRHGETEKDESNPSRGLTEKGISQIRLVSKVIRPFISSNTQILSSDTNRAKQTAQIIGETLSIKDLHILPLRIVGAENIREIVWENEKRKIRPTKTYLSLENYKELNIESPIELAKRWTKELNSINAKTLIVVGHEASLEAFLYNQKVFKLVCKSFKTYFDYGDWAYLIASKLV